MNSKHLILAPNQENVLFAHKLAPNAFSYNVPLLFRLYSKINVQIMQERLNNLVLTNCLFAQLYDDGEKFFFRTMLSPVLINVIHVEFGSNEPASVLRVKP